MKYRISYILIPLIALVQVLAVQAQTIVNGGRVQGGWYKSQSPYIINGNIQIPQEQILQIEAGVVVQFSGPYSITVDGIIEAIGLPKDSIRFTVTDTTGFYDTRGIEGSWRGILFKRHPGQIDMDTSRFVHCLFENSVARDEVTWEHTPADDGGAIKLENLSGLRIEKCEFRNNISNGNGGAITARNGNHGIFVNDCVFRNNKAVYGGAIYLDNTHLKTSGNIYLNNEAMAMGGAVYTTSSRPTLQFSIFDSNKAEKGGAIYFAENTYTDINSCILKKNYASAAGGAMFIDFHASVKITNNYMSLNEAGKYGGAIHIDDFAYSTILLSNSIYKNQSEYGGAISVRNADFTANNNTIVYNQASISGGSIYLTTMYVVKMVNNILFGNWAENANNILFESEPSSATFEYNCFEDANNALTGLNADNPLLVFANNIFGSPGFMNVRLNNYALRDDSKCVDAGDPELYKFETTDQDIKNLPRIFNERIDIGAFEYTPEFLEEEDEFNF